MPDDETVNQMIARSEEEFDQFMVGAFPNSDSFPIVAKRRCSCAFFVSPSSEWTWTGVARMPVTRGGNPV